MINLSNLIGNFRSGVRRTHRLLWGEFEYERGIQSKLTQILINSSDPEELKNKIVREIAVALGANRCLFVEFDAATNNFKKITNTYNTKREAASLLGIDVQEEFPSLAIKRKYLKSLVIEDTDLYLKQHNLEKSKEEEYFKKFEIRSMISVRLEYGENFIGLLVVHYDTKKLLLNKIDLRFLKNIAVHISIALYLSQLYVSEKIKMEKEKLLRSMIAVMSKDFNLKDIVNKVADILAKLYNISSVFIKLETGGLNDLYFYDDFKTKDEKVFNEFEMKQFKIYNSFAFESIKNKSHYVNDSHNFVLQNNLESTEEENFLLINGIKSLLILPVGYDSFFHGQIVLNFDRVNALNEEDIDFIKSVVNQLSIAISQALAFEREKKVAQREQLLRQITEIIRSSLDIEDTFSFICDETAKFFNVQRAIIAQNLSSKGDYVPYLIRREYKIRPDIKGIKGSEQEDELVDYWSKNILKNKELFIIKDFETSATPDFFKNAYKKMGVKSLISVPIKQAEDEWGILILFDYNKKRQWTGEEQLFLNTIANQIYISIKQSELFTKTQSALEKKNELIQKVTEGISTPIENILEISEKIRNNVSLDQNILSDLNNVILFCNQLLNIINEIKENN